MMGCMNRKWWAALLISACFGTGCNLMALPYLLSGLDSKVKPKCPLTSDDKKKVVRVIVMSSAGLETRPEFIRVDRELTHMLIQQMQEGFKDNKESVSIYPVSKIEAWKDNHPDWRSMSPKEIGKQFKADYVINLEIGSISLYEPGSTNLIYHGRAAVSLDVTSVKGDDEKPIYQEEYTCEYPRKLGGLMANDTDSGNGAQFRQKFLSVIAKELSWRFIAHPKDDEYNMQ